MSEERFTVHREPEPEPIPVRWCGQDTEHPEHTWRGLLGGGWYQCAGFERYGFWRFMDEHFAEVILVVLMLMLALLGIFGH